MIPGFQPFPQCISSWVSLKQQEPCQFWSIRPDLAGKAGKGSLLFIVKIPCWRTWAPMFIAALSTIAKRWKQSKCPQIEEWINKVWLNIKWNFIQPLEEGNAHSCYNMDGSWGRHAKWNKPTQEDKHHMTLLIVRGAWRSQIYGDATESKLILLATL